MAKERNDKKKGGGGKIAGAALLLALLGGGGYFGLGVGNPSGGLINPASSGAPAQEISTAVQEATTAEAATTPAEVTTEEDLSVLAIRVTEGKIFYRDKEMTIAALEEALLRDFTDGRSVVIQDDRAVKSAYDEVTALIERLRIPVMTTNSNP